MYIVDNEDLSKTCCQIFRLCFEFEFKTRKKWDVKLNQENIMEFVILKNKLRNVGISKFSSILSINILIKLISHRIKDKVNNPPSNVDHQKVSNTLASFIKLKDQTKAGKVWKKKIQHPEKEPFNKNKVPAKKFPYLKKQVNENDREFANRVKRVTKDSLNEAQFEAKYGVDVVRNSKTGEIQIKKRPKNDLLAKKKKPADVVTKLTTSEKLKLKKINIKEKKLKKRQLNETEYKRDEFIFGEVVHGPPELSTPKHGKKPETTAKVIKLFFFEFIFYLIIFFL